MILQAPFQIKKDTHRISAYSSIIKRLKYRGYRVDLQIHNKKSSADYRRDIEEEFYVKFQLVPPDVHRHNTNERDIQLFKAHFLYILAGVDPTSSKCLW